MKRTLTALVSALVIASILAGCGGGGTTSSAPGTPNAPVTKTAHVSVKEPDPLSNPYQITEQNLNCFTGADSINVVLMASPFYPNMYGLLGAKQDEYEIARDKKVKEIIALSAKIVTASDSLKPRVDTLSGKFLKYVNALATADTRTRAFAAMTTDQTTAFQTKYVLLKAQYDALLAQKSSVGLAQSHIEYMRVAKAFEIGAAVLRQLDDVALWSAWALRDTASSKEAAIVEANKVLDSAMTGMDAFKADVLVLENTMRGVRYGFGQLKNGDYFLARYVARHIAASVPDLRAKLQNLKPTALVQADIIDFAKAYVVFFEKTGQDIENLLKQVDESDLMMALYPDREPGVVYAAGVEDYANAVSAVQAPTPTDTTQNEGYLARGWSGIKTVFNETKSAIGAVVDTGSAAVYSVARAGYAAETGIFGKEGPSLGQKALETAKKQNVENKLLAKTRVSTIKDLADDLESEFSEVRRNYEKGAAGSKVFKTADQYLDAAENKVGDVFEGSTEAVFGKGNASYYAGKIGKITGNMFTSLGRGISKVANTQSTTGEIVEGVLDITFSCMGGSKTLVKGSQVPGLLKGTAEATYNVTHAGKQMLKTVAVNSEKEAYKITQKVIVDKGTKKIVQTVVADNLETLAVQESKRVLAQTNKTIAENLGRITRQGLDTLVKNITTEVPQALGDMFAKKFTASVGGVAKAITTVTGTSIKEFGDNIFGNWLDDKIKALAKDTVDSYAAGTTGAAATPVASAGTPVSAWPTAGRFRFGGDMTYISITNYGLPNMPITFKNGQIESSVTWKGTYPGSSKPTTYGYKQGGKNTSVALTAQEWRQQCSLKVTGKIENGQVSGTYVWESIQDLYGTTKTGGSVYIQRSTFRSTGNITGSGLRSDGTIDLNFSGPITQLIEPKIGDASAPFQGDTLPPLGGYKYVVEKT